MTLAEVLPAVADASLWHDVILPIVAVLAGSTVLLGLIQLWVQTRDRQVEREGKAVGTASDLVQMLRDELKAERERRATVTQELSDRVSALEARLASADDRAERYAALLWETRTELGQRTEQLEQAHRALAQLGDRRSYGSTDPSYDD